MTPGSDESSGQHYGERVDRVCREAAEEFRSSRDDVRAQLNACCRYFESGEREGISHGELIDFLGISGNSVLEQAGYSDHEALRVMALLQLITYDKDGRPEVRDPTSFTINGKEYGRIRFGSGEKDRATPACDDCGVRRESFHLIGCAAEPCPRCGGKAVLCDCFYDKY